MRLAIIGYGKMGKKIEEMARSMGHTIEVIVHHEDELSKLENIDVAIEFTHPESAYNNLRYCLEKGIPVVSGTTGWLDQFDQLSAFCLSTNGSFFYASNFSIGMNIAFKINKLLAQIVPEEYQASIEEIHHTEKKDSPSGTAISLGKPILINRKYNDWINDYSDNPNILPIVSKRIDKVPGTHYVRYESNIDKIELCHEAKSRDGFVLGAIKAAEWLKERKGVFGMQDMLDSHFS